MKLKKILISMLAFAFILTGCSGGSKEVTDVTLKVWAPQEDQDAEQGNWLETMCKQFAEEHPEWNITFEYGVMSEGDVGDTIPQDPEAAADVYMFANDQLGALIDANAISKLGGDTATAVKENNSEAIVDSVTVDGDIYGVPFTSNTWFMYYDTSVFSEEDIKSLDTMLSKGSVTFPLTTGWYTASFFYANGGTMFGTDGTDGAAGIDFGGDKGYAVGEYLLNLVNNPNFVVDADGAGIAALRDGKVSAYFSGTWDATAVKDVLGDNMGAAQLPGITIDGEVKSLKSFFGSKAIGVNPNCANPEVAVALAAYLGGEAAQKAHYEARGIIPTNLKLLEDESVTADPLVKAVNDNIDNTSVIQPYVSEMSQYWNAAEVFTKAVVNGEVTSANVKAQIDAWVDSLNTAAE